MKKTMRILVPILMAVAIVLCLGWYFFVYDCDFTRDILLYSARHFENQGNHQAAAWFYDIAYRQAADNEAVAIELAEQHKAAGNYTQAEHTLSSAISDGGGAELYVALCKTYVEQDKLLDAVGLLDNITNPDIKKQLDAMRPKIPVSLSEPGFYSQYISVEIVSDGSTLYVSANGEYPSVRTDLYQEPVTLQNGENTIYALSVAENGLVSPLAIFGYTVGGVIEEVKFADSAMEQAIRHLLNAEEHAVLFTSDLWEITEFTVPLEAKNYDDLRHMNFLQSLTISGGQAGELHNLSSLANLTALTVTDTEILPEELAMIGNLPMLEKLTLSGCSLAGTEGLENAATLTYLDLSRNTIQHLDALASAKNIRQLFLQNNVIVDLSPLAGMKALQELNVSYNALTSLDPVTGLQTLERLNAGHNSLADVSKLGNLTGLTHLNLKHNKLTDISSLSSCTALETLNVAQNSITDISALETLNAMTFFDFSSNQVAALPQWSSESMLVELVASENLLENLDVLSGFQHLNNVYVDHNPELSSLKPLEKCPALMQVNAYGTKVSNASKLIVDGVIVYYDPTQS